LQKTRKNCKKRTKIAAKIVEKMAIFCARKREKKIFVSGSRQLQPDQPGLQRARKNSHFFYNLHAFWLQFYIFYMYFRAI
jgi:hypothetical protein